MRLFKRHPDKELIDKLEEAQMEKTKAEEKEKKVEMTTKKLRKALEGNKFGERIYTMLIEAQK